MRKTVLAAMTALSVAGLGTGTVAAYAQSAPPPPGPRAEAPPGPFHHRHAGPWMHRPHWDHGRFRGPGTLALVYHHADRHLTPADVQTIAEAFLLWNGNHSWKVVDVAPVPNGKIGFAYATKSGAVIARFTMDPHTGRVTRTG